MTNSFEKKLAVTSVFPSFYKYQAKSGNGQSAMPFRR